MKKLALFAISTALVAPALGSTGASAQEVVQASSQWYTDAQSKIQEIIARQPNTSRAKNVILFVADGMGVGTNYAIRLFDGQQKGMLGEENILPYENFPNLALVKTYNINAQTPDSAPTAGSMNTGVKQVFNNINVSDKAINELSNHLTARSVDGWELHTVFSVEKKGCFGISEGQTYLAVYRKQ